MPVTSSQLSSMEKGSTKSVYRSYTALTFLEYSRYFQWWAGRRIRPGHLRRACHTVSAVLTWNLLAGSFFARMTPWREEGSPHTATGLSRSSG